MKRSVIASVVTAAALIFPVAGPATASAENSRQHETLVRDGRGDVWKCDELGGGCVRAGRVGVADVLRFRAFHGPASLRFKLWFANVKRTFDTQYYIVIKTRDDLHFAEVDAGYGYLGGHHYLLNSSGDDVRSQGMTHQVRYFRDTVTIVIPRALVGEPKWVRVGAVDQVRRETAARYWFEDNPTDHGVHDLGVPLSARLYKS